MAADEIARLLALLEPWALAVGLALARTGGLVLALPHMSARGVPRVVQGIAVLALSLALVGARELPRLAASGPAALVVAALGEFILGVGLGFIIHLALAAVTMAGELVGIEMGLSFAAVADPMSSGQSTAMSALLGGLGVQLAFALGLDHAAVRALVASIDAQPLGQASLSRQLAATLARSGDVLVTTAVSLALPMMGGLFCLKLAMAMLARVAPKLQIFSLAFALSIVTGLLILDVALGSMVSAMSDGLNRAFAHLMHIASRL